MIRKFLRKFSSLLLKIHLYIDRNYKEKTNFAPYILKQGPAGSHTKIVHINGNFVIGGSTQLIVDIIERTSGKYSHLVVVPAHPDPLPYQPVSIYRFAIGELTGLYEFLKEQRPALVHIQYWVREMHRYRDFSLWYTGVFRMCEELDLKVIQNINVPTHPYKSPAVVHNVFVSNYVMDNFNDSAVKASVIYPGSDLSHFSHNNHTQSASGIGMVYRLDTDKLDKDAIEIFITAVKKKPGLKCYIIGGGYYFNYYKKRVKEEGLSSQFQFPGYVSYDSLPGYYKKMAIVVAPVHDESFGQVTPFAMSMGLCIAGYDTGALPEILGYKDTLVRYGNIEELADKIIDLVNNEEKRLQLGQINRHRAQEKFSVEKMITEYEKLYEMYTG